MKSNKNVIAAQNNGIYLSITESIPVPNTGGTHILSAAGTGSRSAQVIASQINSNRVPVASTSVGLFTSRELVTSVYDDTALLSIPTTGAVKQSMIWSGFTPVENLSATSVRSLDCPTLFGGTVWNKIMQYQQWAIRVVNAGSFPFYGTIYFTNAQSENGLISAIFRDTGSYIINLRAKYYTNTLYFYAPHIWGAGGSGGGNIQWTSTLYNFSITNVYVI